MPIGDPSSSEKNLIEGSADLEVKHRNFMVAWIIRIYIKLSLQVLQRII